MKAPQHTCTATRNSSNPCSQSTGPPFPYMHIPTHARLLNTNCNVHVACVHHPHVLAASSSVQRLLKQNNPCAATQLATPYRARSLRTYGRLELSGRGRTAEVTGVCHC